MGIVYANANLLVASRREFALGRTLTLGRQQLFVSRTELQRLAPGLQPSEIDECASPFADSFLKAAAGASEVVSLDFSDYEGAGITHDMNAPIPPGLEQQFDTVIDGGTLEHIFNFPTALANCMRLLRVGGRLFIFTPANNQMGHGFYQFSPELLYRAFSEEHGFVVERMQAVQFRYISTELGTVGRTFDVVDPAVLETRTVVSTNHPVGLMVRARKLAHLAEPFSRAPQQSDYVQVWAAGREGNRTGLSSVTWSRLFECLPGRVRWPLWNQWGRFYRNTMRNRAWFRPADNDW